MRHIIYFFIAMLAPIPLLACSAIAVVKDGRVLLGSNNDYSYASQMKLVTEPARDGLFGRLCISMDTVPGWKPAAMRCINDQGLALTHANVPRAATPYDADKPHFRHNFLEKIVAECATVKQAVNMIRGYTLPAEHGAFIHIMLADASGDAAVVEWSDTDVLVHRSGTPIQFITNHRLSKPETAGGPNSRFNRGARMLPEVSAASPAAVLPVLKEISVYARLKDKEVGTLDTALFDVTGGKVTVYFKRDYDHPLVLDVAHELKNPPKILPFERLFPNPVPFSSEWRDENGPVKRRPSAQ